MVERGRSKPRTQHPNEWGATRNSTARCPHGLSSAQRCPENLGGLVHYLCADLLSLLRGSVVRCAQTQRKRQAIDSLRALRVSLVDIKRVTDSANAPAP